MLVASAKCNLGCEAGCGLTVSCSDHGRIILGSAALVNDVSSVFSNFSEILDGHFSWQAQYLVRLDNDMCCSAHCK